VAAHHDRASTVLAGASALDPLSDVLRAVRLSGACFFRIEAGSPWWAEVPDAAAIAPSILPRAQHLVSYHVITSGRCWAGLADGSGLWVEAGDVVLIPHGDGYALSTEPGPVGRQPVDAARTFFRQLAARELPFTIREGEGAVRVELICGFLGCDALPFNPVLAVLPRLLRIPSAPGAADRLGQLVALALAEAREPGAGGDCVLLGISELMFVEVMRRHVCSLPPDGSGWLAALRDAPVSRALALLHQHPARGWTLPALAREAGLSRSALAERFAHFVGQPPMQYLMRWRLQLAARLLADGETKVGAVAHEVGYESEAAFSRAFKKAVGVSPAAWRRRGSAAPLRRASAAE
jgi:AraC-like DNA-binding protein